MTPRAPAPSLRLIGTVVWLSVSVCAQNYRPLYPVQKAACPGTEQYFDCFYPAVIPPVTCPPGYFCVSPGAKEQCTPGFYCPVNVAQPIFCPAGYFCSSNTTNIQLCPEGYSCPAGTVEPLRCLLAPCPAGSSSVPKHYLFIVFAVLALLCTYAFSRKKHYDKLRAVKHKTQLYELVTEKLPGVAVIGTSAAGGSNGHGAGGPASPTHKDDSEGSNAVQFNIEFENLGLTLPQGTTIMKNVSGKLSAGRACAIMGPSGAGKTTFISLLTNKTKRTTGKIRVNGNVEELARYKRLIGFVPQDDIMLRELTVRDVLMHSARMRLPRDWPFQKVKRHVLELITFLGLSHIMDNVIGDCDTVGPAISGGQRKRVNMALEAVADPSMLFLDEPTSGLDSSTSLEVCRMLRRLAHERSIMVAAIIHSPSPAAFKQFDDLMLLGKGGQIVYMGPREQATEYMAKCGFHCPSEESPADFFMDVTMGKVRSDLDPNFIPKDLFAYWERAKAGGEPVLLNKQLQMKQVGFKSVENLPNPERQMLQEIKDEAQQFYKRTSGMPPDDSASETQRRRKAPWRRALSKFAVSVRMQAISVARWWADVLTEFFWTIVFIICAPFKCRHDPIRETPPAHRKFALLFKRACLQVYRSRGAFMFDQLLHLFCGLFISIAVQNFDYLPAQPASICESTPVALYSACSSPLDYIRFTGIFVSLGVLFAGISAGTNTFGRERSVFWRDTSAGMSTTAYFTTKWIADIPRVILASLMFSLAFILFVSYRSSFGAIFFIILLLYFNAFAIGYFLSAFLRKETVALAGTGFALAWSLALSGVLPDLDEVESDFGPVKFLWYCSAPRWAVEALWLKEVGARPFASNKSIPPPYTYVWDNYWRCCANLALIALVWNVLSFLSLKLCNRRKMK